MATNKISISALDKIAKESFNAVTTTDWHGHALVVKSMLPFSAVMEFVDSVTKSCFAQDSGDYLPEVKDFAIRSNIVDMYTNVSLPENLEHQYQLLYQTDIIVTVLDLIDRMQFDQMISAINSKIKMKAETNAQMLQLRISELANGIGELVDKVAALFDGLNVDDIRNMVTAVGEAGFDESKIVDLVAAKHASVNQ